MTSFELTYKTKKDDAILKDTFDYVVVSTGHFSVPFIPEYPGMKSFPGRIMHSMILEMLKNLEVKMLLF
jgi:trimethylamine monooxygenase